MIQVFNNINTFEQIAPSLVKALSDLGFEVKLTSNIDTNSKDLYIIVALQTVSVLPDKFIVYNFEQLEISSYLGANYFQKLKKAISVWDYSLVNIKYLETKNIDAIHVPFGYTDKLLCNQNTDITRDIDIIFIGGMSDRRKIILKSLAENLDDKITYFFSENCYGNKFDEIINRSKISLNIHYYKNKPWILEVCRIIPLIANGCHVISERSNDLWYDEQFKGKIFFSEIKNISDAVNLINSSDSSDSYQMLKRSQIWLKKEFNHSKLILKSGVTNLLIEG